MDPLGLIGVARVLRDRARLHWVVLEGSRFLSGLEGIASATDRGSLWIVLLVRVVVGAIGDVVQDMSHPVPSCSSHIVLLSVAEVVLTVEAALVGALSDHDHGVRRLLHHDHGVVCRRAQVVARCVDR